MRERTRVEVKARLVVLLAIFLGATPQLRAQSAPKSKPADKPAARADEPASPERAHDDVPGSARVGGLRMSRAVVCSEIEGYEKYKPLAGAAQTSEEKLLVYYRPLRYTVDHADDGYYRAHLIQDNVLRRRGKKDVLRQKKKVVDYEPKSKEGLGPIYIKSTVSLKGLKPGDYELTIVLYDALDPAAPPARQAVPFKIIPPHDTRPEEAPAKNATDPFPEP